MSLKRVLIVDDQHETRQVLRAAIETLPFSVEIVDVPSGEEAMLMLSLQAFDLLVMDIRLAGISGLELMPLVRKRTPDIHIILVTGATEAGLRKKIAEAGAEAYFFKPIEIPEFLNAAQGLLSKNEDSVPVLAVGDSKTEPFQVSFGFDEEKLPDADREHRYFESKKFSLIFQEWVEKVGVIALALADGSGRFFVQAGAWPSQGIFADLSQFAGQLQLLCRDLIKGSVGMHDHETGGWFVADRMILWTAVSEDRFLFGIAERNFLDLHPKGFVDFRMAAQRFSEIFTDNDPNVQIEDNQAQERFDASEQTTESDDILSEIDQLMSAASRQDQPDVDAFWDDAVNQAENKDINLKGLSYDQARKLGLASED